MSLENRPYIGTWKLNQHKLVQHTPDALVYLNGDLSIPGCQKCSGKIDIQKFVTEVSVDAGTEPGSHSATFSLSIPVHHTDSFARDAQFVLKPGLEVHIYMRGYFPVRGLYSHLAENKAASRIEGSGAAPATAKQVLQVTAKDRAGGTSHFSPKSFLGRGESLDNLSAEQIASLNKLAQNMETLQQYMDLVGKALVPNYVPGSASIAITDGWAPPPTVKKTGHVENSQHYLGTAADFKVKYKTSDGRVAEMPRVLLWAATMKLRGDKLSKGGIGAYLEAELKPGAPVGSLNASDYTPTNRWFSVPHVDIRGSNVNWYWYQTPSGATIKKGGEPPPQFAEVLSSLPDPDASVRAWNEQTLQGSLPPVDLSEMVEQPVEDVTGFETVQDTEVRGDYGPSFLEEMGLDGLGIENTLAYPYYHVFHGVVTSVNHSYSGGVSTVAVTCNSMLHFWNYHNMSANAAVFGAQPANSKNKVSLVGNNFSGMHPYAIIYSLHYDMAGAAGGVGFALADKSNQTAVSEGGESLFSLNVKYWEKRFKRGNKLRMHAASGELFTTMAAAWLSRNDSGTLMSALRSRYSTKKDFTRNSIASEMIAVGLWSSPHKRNAIDATRFAAQSQPVPRSASFEINVLEMQAFIPNIGEWGQINLFESTYESKLDAAIKVCQVTGFEFYQDVDGDFVFKPPMWNLDTSSSRVYRIEDIDIINISFSEKEPQVTYMTVKGSHFKGILGTGAENEWGVRGQYIDYRLVAQFGWRPGNYETSYMNDPKSMFFAAVNRMDVMNIANNSATVTIPVRPEFRPGYPVYIPYLDCFYYCNSFAHSHSVGGQCTTALQLVGKRAKFYAPGDVNKSGISAINMADSNLPEKPLQVAGPDGRPKLSGFPNVVMALDPAAVNPLFFVVGLDIENIADTQVLSHMLAVGEQQGVLRRDAVPGPDGFVGYTIDRQTGTGVVPVRFFFDPSNTGPKKSGEKGQAVNIQTAAVNYRALLASYEKTDEDNFQKKSAAQAELNRAQTSLSALLRDPNAKQSAVDKAAQVVNTAKSKLKSITDTLDQQRISREKDMRDFEKNPEFALLLEVYDQTAKAYRSSAGYQAGNNGDLTSTVNLLDMLSNKKAIFTNGQQPGQYRYYSASHPNVEMQGPKTIRYEGRTLKAGAPLPLVNAPVVPMYQESVQGVFSGARTPEAVLVPGRPQVGIKVLTGKPDSDGEILATSDIMELMFAVQEVETVRVATNTKKRSKPSRVSPQLEQNLLAQHLAPQGVPRPEQNVGVVFVAGLQDVFQKARNGLEAMKALVEAEGLFLDVPDEYLDQVPTQISVGSGVVDLNVPFGEYKWEGNSGGVRSLGARMDRLVPTVWLERVRDALAVAVSRYMQDMLSQVSKDVSGADKVLREKVVAAWNTSFVLGEARPAITEQRQAEKVIKKETVYSPVFPISDDAGYRVVGTYRYGRGVDIDPDGAFDQMHKYDIFSLFDRYLVEQILKVFVRKETIQIPKYEEKEINGKRVTVPVGGLVDVGGEEAARYLNQEALRQLRAANLTDAQILDFSGAFIKKEGASQLDFSLANMFADAKRDGVMKVPVVNAAYSLADLGSQQAGHVCNCKASEAAMLIEAFGQQEFLSLDSDEDDMSSSLNSWVQEQGARASVPWEMQQQAFRGQVLDRGGSFVVPSFLNATGLDTAGQPRQSALEAFVAQNEARERDLQAEARKAQAIITGGEDS